MPDEETAPTRGAASSSSSFGYHSEQSDATSPVVESPTLENLASATDGLPFPNELVGVIHERNAARQRSVERQRRDARDAVTRTLPNHPDDPEIVLQRETGELYAKLLELENVGKISWDDWSQDWIPARPTFVYSDSTRPPAYTSDELLGHFDKVRRQGKRWSARCPAHQDRKPSLAISEGDRGWLLRCWTGCTFPEITHAAGLEAQRMFWR